MLNKLTIIIQGFGGPEFGTNLASQKFSSFYFSFQLLWKETSACFWYDSNNW